jgi:ammonia channel protein AmtB
VGAFSFVTSLLVWTAIDKVIGLRVSPDHELRGLDLAELGMEAYPDRAVLAPAEEAAPASGIAAAEPPSFG